jgi:sulfur carrier protein
VTAGPAGRSGRSVPAPEGRAAVAAPGGGPRITVNGEEQELAPGATVASVLAQVGAEPRGVAVAVDGEVVARRTWAEHTLTGGEHVEILSIAKGG